jgi:hypothetical protein
VASRTAPTKDSRHAITPLEKLASLGQPIVGSPPKESFVATFGARSGGALDELLALTNGLFAFESALHIFPASGAHGVAAWNSDTLWRDAHAGMSEGLLFFGEDVFGNGFCLRDAEVVSFEAETGAVQPFAENIDEWARVVLGDSDLHTGFALAHAWQVKHGALPQDQRLLPKKPFVLGGEYVLENLYALDAMKGMRLRGSLAQIRDLPDGAQIRFEVVD